MQVTEHDGFVWAVSDAACIPQLSAVASAAATFDRMNIRHAGGAVYNAASFEGDASDFPPEQRLASVFLNELHRSSDRSEVVEGVPDVSLDVPLHTQQHEAVLRLDAQNTPAAIYGDGAWEVSLGELQRLEQTTRVCVSSDLPPLFYAALMQLTTSPAHQEFFSIFRSVALYRLPQEEARSEMLSLMEGRLASANAELKSLSAEDRFDRYIAETAIQNSLRGIDFITNANSAMQGSISAVTGFLAEVLRRPVEFGFRDRAASLYTVSLSLTELCTGVCISQEGYYFVDGCGSTVNQLCPRAPDTVVFLSAPGLDFCTPSTTRLEMPKYFEEIEGATEATELKLRWKGFTEDGEEKLRKRVKDLYRVVLTSAKLQNVRNPSMLPMGLGVFLQNVNKADHDGVKEAYFRAQFELLTEEDWGFETYWLNPAQHRGFIEELLKKGIERGEFMFSCNFVLHNRDAKFLAVEMTKKGMRAGVLNPSDCIAVMQGLVGYFWELGRGDRYVGEEDFAATGTGILARCGISDVYTDTTRIVQVQTEGPSIHQVAACLACSPLEDVQDYGVVRLLVSMWTPKAIATLAATSLGFSRMDVMNRTGRRFNAGSFEPDKMFPPTLRPAFVFLELLGRDAERCEVVEGVPLVSLLQPLSHLPPEDTVELSAAVGTRYGQTEGVSCEDIWGDKSFSITVAELQRLERTTRVALAEDIPVTFYADLCRLTTDAAHARFFSYLRSVSLAELAVPERWDGVVAFEHARHEEGLAEVKELTGKEDSSWDLYVAETAVVNSTDQMGYFGDRAEGSSLSRSAARWVAFVEALRHCPRRHGFVSSEHLEYVLSLSLTELCTGVCISQEGYYFVDGCGPAMNQLCPRTPDTVVFLSAPGLDFCTPSTTRLEMPKYFEEIEGATEATELKLRWKGFTEDGEEKLRKRVKDLYRVVLTSAKLQNVRNPSMLPMGLGVFLQNVNKADHDGVKEAYFRAQFELLTEEDWGFETYWLNPAQHRGFIEELLKKGIERGEFLFSCNFVLHNRDAKFLAVEMAKKGMRAGVLNPSDCIAVMQGLVGYFWELGRGDRYVGEEDFAATGTGILARCGISDVYTDTTRIVQVQTGLTAPGPCATSTTEVHHDSFAYYLPDGARVDQGVHDLATEAAKFQYCNIKGAGREHVYNAGSFHPEKQFNCNKRLAATFLGLLGRSDARDPIVEGVPDVQLATPLHRLHDDKTLTLDAAAVDRLSTPECPTGEELYGTGCFSITAGEVKRLERSTRIVLDRRIPEAFYAAVARVTTDGRYAEFFSILRSVPLACLHEPSVWAGVVEKEQLRESASAQLVEQLHAELKQGGERAADDIEWDLYIEETAVRSASRIMDYLQGAVHASGVLQAWAATLQCLTYDPLRYGFDSAAHLEDVLSLSLTELCTGVCISQEGYYFVDGCGSTVNQLCPRTPDTVVFLSAPGLDFCTPSTTRLEMPKYFEEIEGATEATELKLRWKGFTEDGEEKLRKRVKDLYRVVLTSAKLQNVRNPSMLPMGLGVFLQNVNKADHDGVKEAYFRAQFELLTEEDWGFETYWLNPAQHRGFIEELLKKGIERGEFMFSCNFVLHNRDAKFLAVEMAKKGMRAGVLNPSDCIAVMQGLVGYFWELGRGDRYVGEEDFAATGTGILARCGISDVYTDTARITRAQQHDPAAAEPAPSDVSSGAEEEEADHWVAFNETLSLDNIYAAVVHVGMLLKSGVGLTVREELIDNIKAFCVARPAIWNERGMDGKTLMYLACSSGDLPLASSFHLHGCPLCEPGTFVDTPLHGAALHCHVGVVVWLVTSGHPLNLLNKQGMSVFDAALCRTGFTDAKYKTKEQAQLCYKLLQAAPTLSDLSEAEKARGAVSEEDSTHWDRQLRAGVHTDLHLAVIRGDITTVTDVVARSKKNDHTAQRLLDAPDPARLTALHWAVIMDNTLAVHSLLGASDASMRAKVDIEDRDGWTPLHLAVLLGRLPIVELLLSHNAERGRPLHLVPHINFQNSIWEDRSDPSRYVLRLHEQSAHLRRKDLLGPWVRTKEGADMVLLRTFKGTHAFKGGAQEQVVLKAILKPGGQQFQGFKLLVCLTERDAICWWGVYDARSGVIEKRCRGWQSACTPGGGPDSRCQACGCRDYLPAGLCPSIGLTRVLRGRLSGTALHAACTAAMLPPAHGTIASHCSGYVAESIALRLLGPETMARSARHRNFLLALDADGNTAFAIIVRGILVEHRDVKGAAFIRRFWGCPEQAQPGVPDPSKQDIGGGSAALLWENSFSTEGCSVERMSVCRQSLALCEQHIPHQLVVSLPKFPHASGVYERQEYCGRNRWPEYRYTAGASKQHALQSDDRGRWVVVRIGPAEEQVVLAHSRPHGGVMPQHIDVWQAASGETGPVEMKVECDLSLLTRATPTVPKEFEQLGWLMTVKMRCTEPVALSFVRALYGTCGCPNPLDLRASWDYAILNAAAMPGAKGEGDTRLVKDSLSFHRAAHRELITSVLDDTPATATDSNTRQPEKEGSMVDDMFISAAAHPPADSEVFDSANLVDTTTRMALEQIGPLLSSALHCASVYGRRLTIRCLIGECGAAVEVQHLKTSVEWERWDEAKEILEHIRNAFDLRCPLTVFTNGVVVAGHAQYDVLPSLNELRFCAENEVAAPGVYVDLLGNHLQLLKRVMAPPRSASNLQRQAGAKARLTWDATPHASQEVMRFLLSVRGIDYPEFLKDPEARKAFNGFDFGSTPRSAELYLAMSRALSSPEVASIIRSKGTRGLHDEWFTRGFSIAGVKFEPHDYCALRYPLHVLLVKTAGSRGGSSGNGQSGDDSTDFRKKCRLLLLECVRLVNASAEGRDHDEFVELASHVPKSLSPLPVQVVPSTQTVFARRMLLRKRNPRRLLQGGQAGGAPGIRQAPKGEATFAIPAAAAPAAAQGRGEEKSAEVRMEDLSENQWCLLPIELAVELCLVDVLEQMLKGGVVMSDTPLKGRNSNGDFIRLRCYRDIWFPRSAEYIEQPGGTHCELNWNRFSPNDGAPLLHRTLERLSIPIHSVNTEAMHTSRVQLMPLESPSIPHLPPGEGEAMHMFLTSAEDRVDPADNARRQMVSMLMRSSFTHRRDLFTKSVYVGESRPVEKAELVNTKWLDIPDSPTSSRTDSAASAATSAEVGAYSLSPMLLAHGIPSHSEVPGDSNMVQKAKSSARPDKLARRLQSFRMMNGKARSGVGVLGGGGGGGGGSANPGWPGEGVSGGQDDERSAKAEEADLASVLQCIGAYFDRCGIFAMGAKKWQESSLATAAAAAAASLAALACTCVEKPYLVLTLLRVMSAHSSRKPRNDPDIDVSDVQIIRKKRTPPQLEFGLAKLLQRAPWVVAEPPESATLPLVLKAHPFLSANQLEKKMTTSITPIYIERRHRWTRSLRTIETAAPLGHTTTYQQEAPGEQDQLKDDRLSLLHWLSLLNAPDLLSLATAELGDPVMKQAKRGPGAPQHGMVAEPARDALQKAHPGAVPGGQLQQGGGEGSVGQEGEPGFFPQGSALMPTRRTKLGFTAAHYAAYSCSTDCLKVLVDRAQEDCGDSGVRMLLDYQVRCCCHPDIIWQQASDSSVHHNGLLCTTGDTALMTASQFAHFTVTQALLQAGASAGLKNHEGMDCHDIAIALSFRQQQQIGVSEEHALAMARANVDDQAEPEAAVETLLAEKGEDPISPEVPETLRVLNRQITQLNADQALHTKLENFAEKKAFAQALWYVLFLILLTVVTFRITTYDVLASTDRFWSSMSLSSHVSSMKAAPPTDPLGRIQPYINDFKSTSSLGDLQKWIETALPFLLLRGPVFNEGICTDQSVMGVYDLVGAARVSILRVLPEQCPRGSLASGCDPSGGTPRLCFPAYGEGDTDGASATLTPNNTRWRKRGVYTFTSSQTSIAYAVDEGEVVDVQLSDEPTLASVRAGEFLDPTVRLFSLMLTYYQPSVDMTVVAAFHVESLPHGYVMPSVDVVAMRVDPYSSWSGTGGLFAFLEAWLFLYILMFISVVMLDFYQFASRVASRVLGLVKNVLHDVDGQRARHRREFLRNETMRQQQQHKPQPVTPYLMEERGAASPASQQQQQQQHQQHPLRIDTALTLAKPAPPAKRHSAFDNKDPEEAADEHAPLVGVSPRRAQPAQHPDQGGAGGSGIGGVAIDIGAVKGSPRDNVSDDGGCAEASRGGQPLNAVVARGCSKRGSAAVTPVAAAAAAAPGVRFASEVTVLHSEGTEDASFSERGFSCITQGASQDVLTQKTIEIIRARRERDEGDSDTSQHSDSSSDSEACFSPLEIREVGSPLPSSAPSVGPQCGFRLLNGESLDPAVVLRSQACPCRCEDCIAKSNFFGSKLRKLKRYIIYVASFFNILLRETIVFVFASGKLVDILMAILLAAASYIRIKIFILSDEDISNALSHGDSQVFYEDFVEIASSFTHLHLLLGIVMLLAWVKGLKTLVIVPKIGPVIRAIIHTMGHRKVLLFFLLYIEVLVAFVFGLYIAFGGQLHSYHSIGQSLFIVLRIVLGDYPGVGGFDDLLVAHYMLGPVFYVFLVVFGQLLFLNILIAVVGEVYQKAAEATTRDWSKQISLMYQFTVCRRADKAEHPFVFLFQKLQRNNQIPLFCWRVAEDDERLKSPTSHQLAWEVVASSTISAYVKERQQQHLSLAQVDVSVEKSAKSIMSILRKQGTTVQQQQQPSGADEDSHDKRQLVAHR